MTQDNKVDPGRSHAPAPSDRDRGYSGEDYRADDERALGRDLPAGEVPPPGTLTPDDGGESDPNLPRDNGARASVDPTTGEVRGSGVGAGGGQPGEDMDQDSATGDGPVITGTER